MRTPDNYRHADESALMQQARLIDCTWEGATVTELTGQVAEVFPHDPIFSRHPFRVGGEENRFKDEIQRAPLKITDEPMPVAMVSKTYSLIQHRDVLASVFRALKMIHIDISGRRIVTLAFGIWRADALELCHPEHGLRPRRWSPSRAADQLLELG